MKAQLLNSVALTLVQAVCVHAHEDGAIAAILIKDVNGNPVPVATDEAVDVTTDAAPACADFSKNGVGPITDRKSCEDACYTAEGLSKPACCDIEDFKGANGTAKCECCSGTSGLSCNSYRSVCEDPDFDSSNGAFLRAGNLALVSLLTFLPRLV